MRRLVVPTWTALVVILAGLWALVVPFVGNAFSTSSGMAMQHMATSSGISATTIWYHIVPGGLALLAGLYQVGASWLRASRTAASRATEHEVKAASATS